jgi:hypothetical protein
VSQVRLYIDEDAIHREVVVGLRARGFDVLTPVEAEMVSRDDEDHLDAAATRGRAVYSFNARDFYRIHTEWVTAGRGHAGIILAEQQRYSAGEQIRRLAALVSTLSAEEMQNRVEFLSGW